MRLTVALGVIAVVVAVGPAGASIYLDADTPETGGNLNVSPLDTPYGTITYDGEINPRQNDHDFNAAGAYGMVFDIYNAPDSYAWMMFEFEVVKATFIYGGNSGVFDIRALDNDGNIVDSFYQASTGPGEPAGPISLEGAGIRSLYWQDPGMSFASIDNVTIEVAPGLPALALLGVVPLFGRVRRWVSGK